MDPNGPDNDWATASDNEECDDGASNGVLGGPCTNLCRDPSNSCYLCWETCEETEIDETHVIYLLVDKS